MKNAAFSLPLFTLIAVLCLTAGALAQTLDIQGPTGSERFGKRVFSLPNGNVVVTDPFYDSGSIHDAGAVYLYDGEGDLISTMTGTHGYDQISDGGVTVLPSGNFVVVSPNWNSDTTTRVGAATWCSMTTGCPPIIAEASSLIGSNPYDSIGLDGLTVLPNGNYVVFSSYWHRDASSGTQGAVTWGNGLTGISGPVSESNSLYGPDGNDHAGQDGIVTLSNGNYVVRCPSCSGNRGAATFCQGNTGRSGVINSSNSLVGSSTGDTVGKVVVPLTNGNYVVASQTWKLVGSPSLANVGAVTWANGTTGITGPVTSANSLTGSKANDGVGGGVTPLTNGNYVVRSGGWDSGSIEDVGAATWANGATGITGPVTTANSLTGSQKWDYVGGKVMALTNGNYVVASPAWNQGPFVDVGAVVWGDGAAGTTGPVTTANALYGSWHHDAIGIDGVVALPNGNFVVISSEWDNPVTGADMAGAVTWGNGTSIPTGPVSAANSLIGSSTNDRIGSYDGVVPLNNGNYVVVSPSWSNGSITAVGAVTWANGTTGINGPVSDTNSLTGSQFGDVVGVLGVIALSNGNYVVTSSAWNNGPISRAGAVTWANGTTGITGHVSALNSLVGSTADDEVGKSGVSPGSGPSALASGDYVVISYHWNNGAVSDSGAVTICNGTIGKKGVVSAANSLLGTAELGGWGMNVSFDAARNQLAIGRAAENLVTLVPQAVPAASASVSGRVTDANGTPIRNAIVSLTAPNGQRITAQTGSLGFYLFDNVQTGQPYAVSASAKRYRFDPRNVFIDSNIADLNFTAR